MQARRAGAQLSAGRVRSYVETKVAPDFSQSAHPASPPRQSIPRLCPKLRPASAIGRLVRAGRLAIPRPWFRHRFEGWSPEVFELLDNTPFEEIEQRDLYDRPPQVTAPPLSNRGGGGPLLYRGGGVTTPTPTTTPSPLIIGEGGRGALCCPLPHRPSDTSCFPLAVAGHLVLRPRLPAGRRRAPDDA